MPNCPGAKLSGAKLSWCQIVRVPNCPLLLSWCQIVRFYYLGAKLSALLSWCQIFRCQIVRCQIVWCQIVLQSREFLAENGGLGKNHDNPPSDFGLEIENDRKRAFLKFGRDGVKSWWKYQDWLEEECALFRESVKNSKGKKPVEDEEDHDEESNNQIRLLRERSSGKNIWDAEKITFSKCHDGSIRKSVIKETYA